MEGKRTISGNYFPQKNVSSFLQFRFATVTDVVQKAAVNSQNVLNIWSLLNIFKDLYSQQKKGGYNLLL